MKPAAVKSLFTHAKPTPDVVQLETRNTLAISGMGDPAAEEFQRSIGALFAIGFTLKFQRKAQGLDDFTVGPLEGEWSIDGPDRRFNEIPRGEWLWELRFTIPDDVTDAQVEAAVRAAASRKGTTKEAALMMQRVIREVVPPGRFGRVLHVGPYVDEPQTFEKLERFLSEHGDARLIGHTEVYLSDPRRTAPDKIKTALLVRLVDA